MHQLQDSYVKHKIQTKFPPGVVLDVAILVAEGVTKDVTILKQARKLTYSNLTHTA